MSPALGAEGPGILELHRWRRLDWHLLLPEFSASRVACAGAVDDELRNALPLLAGELHEPRTPADWRSLSGTCDAVVLVRPARTDLHRAAELLRPGGWLYAEVRRMTFASRPGTVPGWRAELVRLGLRDVSAHWHLTGPAGPTTLVSLDSRTAVRAAIRQREGGRLGSTPGRVTEGLLDLRLLPWVIREGSVAGRRPLPPSRTSSSAPSPTTGTTSA